MGDISLLNGLSESLSLVPEFCKQYRLLIYILDIFIVWLGANKTRINIITFQFTVPEDYDAINNNFH